MVTITSSLDFGYQSPGLLWCKPQDDGQNTDKVGLKMDDECQHAFFKCSSLTLISLCSRNCNITFLRYSKLISSSPLDGAGDARPGDAVRDGRSEVDDIEARESVFSLRDVQ
jgi:hypothetical protein